MAGVILGFLALGPLMALFGAFFRAIVLFWPTMILLGAVHTHLPWVPNLGYAATFLVVALISLLVPTGSDASVKTN